MIENFIIADSGMYKVINLLKKTKRGTILTVDDFRGIEGLSYTHIRSIFVTLCERKVLIRVCRGVYCYPIIKDDKPVFPPIDVVLSKIAEKENFEICPAGEYAKYLLGIRETIPSNVVCYNNDKVKTINFENGISVKVMPSKKYFSPFIKNANLRMLINYINNVGISNIDECDKAKLIEYYKDLDKTESIPSEIVSFLQ